jgi:hypothetical protein
MPHIPVAPTRGGRGHIEEVVGKNLDGVGDAFFSSGWYVGAMAPAVVPSVCSASARGFEFALGL